ncbi:hypothetical protein BJ166DRAFT_495940 [Pestalotiopsis sp. NC0098]|nr:hypothetical protein BJ166DRAFT_495940 [Pestalotiopsis sp. NC0098]
MSFPAAAEIVEEINRKCPADEKDEKGAGVSHKIYCTRLEDGLLGERWHSEGTSGVGLPATRVAGDVAGKQEKTIDLLDLPTGALDCRQWAVYLDVPTRLSAFSIFHVPDARSHTNGLIKTITPGTNLRSASETKVYVGSAALAWRAFTRTTQHLRAANPSAEADFRAIERTAHYAFNSQQDTVPNLFLGAAVGRADTSNKNELTKARIPVVVLEAILITYLSLLPRGIDTQYCPATVPKFNDFLRDSLDLPNFSNVALNRSRPLSLQSGSWRRRWNFYGVPGDEYRRKTCKYFLET